jgi:hypothetical protein
MPKGYDLCYYTVLGDIYHLSQLNTAFLFCFNDKLKKVENYQIENGGYFINISCLKKYWSENGRLSQER